MSKMNPVVHFEMPADDRERMSSFYTNVFGWKTEMMGKDMGNYVVVSTAETGKDGRSLEPGTINGGFYPKKDSETQFPSFVIAVDDVFEHTKKITSAGGKVLGEPVDIPNVGRYVSFIDTEGNRASILQATKSMR